MPISYADLIDKSGTIYNTKTQQGYSSPDALATDLGISASAINWGQIASNPNYTPLSLGTTPTAPVAQTPTAFVGYTKTANNPTIYGQTANGQSVAFENPQQFDQSGGNLANVQTIATPPPAAVAYSQYQGTVQRNQAADTANAEAQKIFDSLGKSEIDTRESSKLLADIKDKLAVAPPAQPSLVKTFQQQSEALGITELNTKLQGYDQQIKAIDTELLVQGDTAGDLTVSQTKINQKRSSLQKEADIRKAYISLERNAVATQLNGKIATLNTIMDLTGQDYTNATTYYNASLDRSVKLYDLLSGQETTQQNEQDKLKTQANANLSTIQNLITEKGLKYDSLTPAQKTQISLLELQAGLPAGATAAISTSAGTGKVLTTTSRQESNGNTYYDSLIQQPDGSMKVVSIFKGKEKVTNSGGKIDTTPTEQVSGQLAKQYLDQNKGQKDNYVSPQNWSIALDAWLQDGHSQATFISRFKKYTNPADPQDYEGIE